MRASSKLASASRRSVWPLVCVLTLTTALLPACTSAGRGDVPAGEDDAGAPPPAPDSGRAMIDAGPRSDLSHAVLMTTSGPVQGDVVDGLARFRGVPYAAAPVGDLRWRAPVRVDPWTTPRDGTQYGAACMQPDHPLLPEPDQPQSEDCLFVNAWTAAHDSSERRPVMVWIHGGGWTTGASSNPWYDGTALAREHGVVVVSMNYRLGALGFIGHPLLTAESGDHASSNFGILDQIAALEWVRENAAELGGDPSNVTIFGESAGGGSVCVLLASPLTEGLFSRAIVESAACTKSMRDLRATTAQWDSAESVGEQLGAALGCEDASDVLSCMRGASADRVIGALPTSMGLVDPGIKFWPGTDGFVLTETPGAAIEAGRHHHVPVVVGANEDEGALFRPFFAEIDTLVEYDLFLRAQFGPYADAIRAVYPVRWPAEVNPTVERILGDLTFVCAAREAVRDLARVDARTYLYHFSWVGPIGERYGLGAYHGSEIPYVFDHLDPADGDYDDTDRAIAHETAGYWARFATTGDPNGDGAPEWPRYDPATDRDLRIDSPLAAESGLRRDVCDALQWLY